LQAAQILSDRESAILPTYGGRFWTVKYELKEDRRLAMEIEKRDRDKRDAVARQKAKTVKPAKKKPSKKVRLDEERSDSNTITNNLPIVASLLALILTHFAIRFAHRR